jgi:biopolymer transport protein ExbD
MRPVQHSTRSADPAMPLPSFVRNRPPSEAAEIELDLTPMMSMFLILLPFLVSMAVLTHLTIIEFSLPPNVGAGLQREASEKPRLKLTVVLAPEFLLVTYGDRLLDSLPASEAMVNDFAPVTAVLAARKKELQLADEMVIASNDRIRLKNIVALMDRCRAAGFGKIGLSSATDDPREGK